jgi:hypothetical protein
MAQASLNDGELFSLDDGVNPPVTFEFDLEAVAKVGPGRVRVDLSAAVTAGDVATEIVSSVNGVGATLAITATSGAAGTLTLSNDAVGSFGNTAIFRSIASAGFLVSGMTGGGGKDCGLNVGCKVDDDCAGGLTCKGSGAKTCK